MSKKMERAVDIILDAIRNRHPNETVITLPIEGIPENVELFRRALTRVFKVEQAMLRAGVTVELKIVQPHIEQAKERILGYIRGQGENARNAHIVFPTYAADASDMKRALSLPEVQQEISDRNLIVEIRVVNSKTPDIVLATYEDAASGKLDEFMRKFEG